MYQVLFKIPTPWFEIPIYGFGAMLVIALFLCTWLAGRRAKREGIDADHIQDLALWVVISGILGARVVYMIQFKRPLSEFLQLWEGGLVYYGSVLGGTIGLILSYLLVFRRHNLSFLRLADVIAPSAALGLCLGRIGCLLNGCCFGDVACPDCPSIGFPLSAQARYQLVDRGLQTTAGFTLDPDYHQSVVGRVEPKSPAWKAGLRAGDRIVAVNGKENRVVLILEGNASKLKELAQNLKKRDRGEVNLVERDDIITAVKVFYKDPNDLELDRREANLVSGHGIESIEVRDELWEQLAIDWPRGHQYLSLKVKHEGEEDPEELPPFRPTTIGLHPTQVYETITTGLLFLFLSALFPFRTAPGQVMGTFLSIYAIHRFANELLRNDTAPVAFGMTLSQNGSILILLLGLYVLNYDRVMRWLAPVRRMLLGR